jgi:pimeloyl-ACP methyl ester carboxylesterase
MTQPLTGTEYRRYQRLNRGGHFPAVENPSGLASEIRAFFTSVSS